MSANIPAKGIKAYMDTEVERVLPPNGWWKFQDKVHHSVRWWMPVLAACFVGIFVFDYRRGATFATQLGTNTWWIDRVMSMLVDAAAIVGLSAAMLYILISLPTRNPGQWRHYSLKKFTLRYGQWHIPAFEEIMHAIRKGKPGAEFEIAALEQPFPGPNQKPVHFGLVLFQISDKAGQVFDFDGIPLRVCSSTGYHLTFDLQAAPAGAL